jgi:hypothetical protein
MRALQWRRFIRRRLFPDQGHLRAMVLLGVLAD